jgi:hypothetical protein
VVGRKFFPTIIQKAFAAGLHPALDFATIICAMAAVTSWMRGTRPALVTNETALEGATPLS